MERKKRQLSLMTVFLSLILMLSSSRKRYPYLARTPYYISYFTAAAKRPKFTWSNQPHFFLIYVRTDGRMSGRSKEAQALMIDEYERIFYWPCIKLNSGRDREKKEKIDTNMKSLRARFSRL